MLSAASQSVGGSLSLSAASHAVGGLSCCRLPLSLSAAPSQSVGNPSHYVGGCCRRLPLSLLSAAPLSVCGPSLCRRPLSHAFGGLSCFRWPLMLSVASLTLSAVSLTGLSEMRLLSLCRQPLSLCR
jgi:hypothetical protein